MHLYAALILALPHAILATTVPTGVSQVIVPFSSLPACALNCGPLFDAQGACGQTALTSTSQSCFCKYPTLQPFYTTSTGVCGTGCAGDTTSLNAIQSWFESYCGASAAVSSTVAASSQTASATGTANQSGTAAATSKPTLSGTTVPASGGSWLDTHYQYVIMIVIIFVAIVGGWIGACLLRRRYIRKRERAYDMRPPPPVWASNDNFGAPEPARGGVATYFGSKGKSPLRREVVSEVPSMSEPAKVTKHKRWGRS